MPLMAGTPLFNILAGAGGALGGYESAWEAAQKRDLEQQRINLEKQRIQSDELYKQQLLNQRMVPTGPLVGMVKTLGLDPVAVGITGDTMDERLMGVLSPIFA